MKRIILLAVAACIAYTGIAQSVGIGTTTPDQSAMLEIRTTNKGLLLPRVNDTSSVANPVKGLMIFNNRDNNTWLHNGSRWQSTAGGANNIWTSPNDSTAFTSKRQVHINIDPTTTDARANLAVNGNLLVQTAQGFSRSTPTPAQTYTLPATGFPAVSGSDSVFRILDPGGTGDYSNNIQTAISVSKSGDNQEGFRIRFNPADFGLGDGDTLWISASLFPGCRDRHTIQLTKDDVAPGDVTTSDNIVIFTFRTNGAVTSRGFDITVRRLYATTKDIPSSISTSGSALYFYDGSFSAGFNSNSFGKRSLAIGDDAHTYAENAVAIGNDVVAQGRGSFAIGNLSLSSGEMGIAMGTGASVTGKSAVSIGNTSTAIGENSIALGHLSRAEALSSFAIGQGTVSRKTNSISLGMYNDNADPLDNTIQPRDRIFQLGNGNSNTDRSNALTVLRNGNVGIGIVSPNGLLQFANTANNRKIVLFETANNDVDYYGFGINNNNLRYSVSGSGSHVFYSGTTQLLSIAGNGNAVLTGTLTQNSDARLKRNIQPLTHNLDRLQQINGYSYYWKDAAKDPAQQTGLLAQEIKAVFPQLVQTDAQGVMSVNYIGLTPILIESIKELNHKIARQQEQINELLRMMKK